MIENIGLNALLFSPDLIAGEEINLYGYSVSGWFFLTDNQIHILIDNRKDVYKRQDINHLYLPVHRRTFYKHSVYTCGMYT